MRAPSGLAGVTVEIVPDRGPMLTCVTKENGGCEPMWVFPSLLGVRGTKTGCQPIQLSIPPDGGFSYLVNLRMTAISTS